MFEIDCAPERVAEPNGFRVEDFAGHPEAMEAWLSGDWSRVEERDPEDVRAA